MTLKTRRILSLILVLMMVFAAIPAVSAYTGVSDWAEDKIAAMNDLGLIPDTLSDSDLSKNITRLDMCKAAMLAYTKVTGKTVDVPATHPFTDTTDPDVEKAYSIGLIAGNGKGLFRPNDALKRVEFFCIVTTFLKLVDFPISDNNQADLSPYTDESTLPDWGYNRTQVAVGLGITAGTGSSLSWDKNTASQEALTMFYRAYNLATNNAEPNVPPETVPPTTPAPDSSAGDFINLSDWASDSVNKMSDLGLIPEEVRNSPMDGSITRTNMCKVIMLAYKQLTGVSDQDLGTPTENPFSDTNDLDVLNAYRLGFVKGKGNGVFGADDPITRQDFITISVKFLNNIGYGYIDDRGVDLGAFHDSELLADYAISPSRLLISIGALSGNANKMLNPRDAIVCQEALCIFYKIHHFVTTWVASSADDNRTEISKNEALSVVEFAKKYLGCDYVYGGKDPDTGFDCSGFVYYVYKHFGYTLNPGAWNQWDTLTTTVSRDNLLPGDLVFFSDDGTPDGMSHVAIYIGNNEIIHASTPSTGVIISDLNEPYYVRMYLDAKRVIE